MNISVEDQDGVKLLRLEGEFVGGGGEKFVETVTNLLTTRGARVVIEMSQVPFMNSSGLSELVRVVAQANIQEGRIVLAGLSPFVAGVMQTTQLERFFEISNSPDEAVAKLRP
jgi:anti-anti-sigma factor